MARKVLHFNTTPLPLREQRFCQSSSGLSEQHQVSFPSNFGFLVSQGGGGGARWHHPFHPRRKPSSTQVTHRANRKKRLTVPYIVEHPNQEGDTCIDWTSQYCWTNGWNCLWRGHSVYRNRPLIPHQVSHRQVVPGTAYGKGLMPRCGSPYGCLTGVLHPAQLSTLRWIFG